MNCPDAERLRAYAEPGEDAELLAHLGVCCVCQHLLELAKAEEAALRSALPTETPEGLLASTLAAVSKKSRPGRPARRRSRLRKAEGFPWGPALVTAGLVLVGLAWVSSHEPMPPADEPPSPRVAPPERDLPPAPLARPPAPQGRPVPDPDPATSVDAPPVKSPANESSPEELRAPEEIVVSRPKPDEAPSAEPPVESPGPPPSSQAPGQLAQGAVLRSGTLFEGKRSLTEGDALPKAELRVTSSVVEIECPTAVRFWLARRSRFRVTQGSDGGFLIELERGRLFASSQGSSSYSVRTPEGLATPLGTTFQVSRAGAKTHVLTVEGQVRLEGSQSTVVVRAGYETLVSGTGGAELPLPVSSTKALRWLPRALRSATKLPARPQVEGVFSFEGGREDFTHGELRRVDGRACLRAVPWTRSYSVIVRFERSDPPVLILDPDLWIEASCKVDRETKVAFQVFDFERRENWSHITTLKPDRWVHLARASCSGT